jgi:alpha-galactosidase
MTALPFRLATALFGHAGIEMDLTACTADEREVLRAWSRLYKELRGLLHSGRLVRADLADPATLLTGVVAQDGSEALFSWSRLHTSPPGHAGRVRIPGLDPHRGYRITARTELGEPSLHEKPPAWLAVARADGHLATGVLLGAVGLPMPTLNPQQALLLHATAV